jgi:IstB-like ATP binding protein
VRRGLWSADPGADHSRNGYRARELHSRPWHDRAANPQAADRVLLSRRGDCRRGPARCWIGVVLGPVITHEQHPTPFGSPESSARGGDSRRSSGKVLTIAGDGRDIPAAVPARHDVVLLGPPSTGKTHLATGLGIAAANHGHRVLFATATEWVTRLTDTHRAGRLHNELARLRRYGLIIIDEVGYLPFEQDAANLFFQLVSSRYEHASLILTSNLPFSGWGGVFGDQAVAAAMIDRVVHHADVLTLKGASYRLRNRGIETLPSIRTQDAAN